MFSFLHTWAQMCRYAHLCRCTETGAAFICPAKRTDPKCAKFTQLKEMALSIYSRYCKAEGTH